MIGIRAIAFTRLIDVKFKILLLRLRIVLSMPELAKKAQSLMVYINILSTLIRYLLLTNKILNNGCKVLRQASCFWLFVFILKLENFIIRFLLSSLQPHILARIERIPIRIYKYNIGDLISYNGVKLDLFCYKLNFTKLDISCLIL